MYINNIMSSAFFKKNTTRLGHENNKLSSSDLTNNLSRKTIMKSTSENNNCQIKYFNNYSLYIDGNYTLLKDCSNVTYNNTFFDICSVILTDSCNNYFKNKSNSATNVFHRNNTNNYNEYNYILDICNTIKGIHKLPYCGYDISNIRNNFGDYKNYYKIINKLKLDCNITKPTFYSGISYEEYIKIIVNNNKNLDTCM